MTAHSPVAIDNDLASGQTRVALGTTDDETAGGIDEELRFPGQEVFGQRLLDDFLDAEFFDPPVAHLGAVLRGNDDVGDANGLVVHVFHRDLALGVGAQPFDFAALANASEFAAQLMGEHDRGGHQFGRFIASVTEHQSLITGSLLGLLLAFGRLGIDALRDVGRLLRDDGVHEHLVRMKHIVVVHVADFADGFAGQLREIQLGLGRDFTAHDHDVRLHVSLTSHAAELVHRETRVQDRVRNGICDLVRMAFADGLRRKDESIAH